MTLSEIDRLFTEARALGVYFLSINGGIGEPLMRKDIVAILKIAQREGFATNLITNGLKIDRDLAIQMLSTDLFKLHISLDGATEATHDKIRGIKGAFKQTIHSLKLLCDVKQELGVRTRIHTDTVITGINLHEILDIVTLVESIGAEFLCQPIFLGPCIPALRDDLWIGEDRLAELESVIASLKRYKRNRGVVLNTNRHLDMIVHYFENPDTCRLNDVCSYPLMSLTVLPQGDVTTCLQRIGGGNIRNKSLISILNSLDFTKRNLYCRYICINPCLHLHDQMFDFLYEDIVLPFLRSHTSWSLRSRKQVSP